MSKATRRVAPPAGQPTLFDLAAGLAGKRVGMARAAASADPAWREFAYLVLRGLAATRREVHVDDLYVACAWHPPSPNAWGAV